MNNKGNFNTIIVQFLSTARDIFEKFIESCGYFAWHFFV